MRSANLRAPAAKATVVSLFAKVDTLLVTDQQYWSLVTNIDHWSPTLITDQQYWSLISSWLMINWWSWLESTNAGWKSHIGSVFSAKVKDRSHKLETNRTECQYWSLIWWMIIWWWESKAKVRDMATIKDWKRDESNQRMSDNRSPLMVADDQCIISFDDQFIIRLWSALWLSLVGHQG